MTRRFETIVIIALALFWVACRAPVAAKLPASAPTIGDATPPTPGTAGDTARDPGQASGLLDGGLVEQGAGGQNAVSTGLDSGSSLPVDAGVSLVVTPDPTDEASYIFDQTQLRTYNLIIAQSDLDTIDKNPKAEMYVPAMLEFESKTYGPYQVRYKGSYGSFAPPCISALDSMTKAGKCSMKVDFNAVDSNARFYGLKKLNFHAMNGDQSMLRERLGYSLFRESGIAAPRSMHARLLINGVLEGLFIVVEQIDDRFTRSRFAEGGKGNLYKEVWPNTGDPSAYLAALQTNTKAQPPATAQRILAFKAAIDMGTDAARHFIDRDYMLRYTAVDRVIINDDGAYHFYCDPPMPGTPDHVTNHNYYWYEARLADRLWLVPWDLDISFDGYAPARTERPWNAKAPCMCALNSQGQYERPATCDPFVAELASWTTDFNAAVDAFIAGPFAPDPVNTKLSTWSSQIQNAVIEAAGRNSAPSLTAWLYATTQLRATIDNARTHRGYAY